MKYLSDIHALNLPCSLGTTGDWHTSSIQWDNLKILESENSPFGDYGIEKNSNVKVPGHQNEVYNIANHVRACLDLIAMGKFTVAGNMRRDYLDDNEQYDQDIFENVYLLKNQSNWEKIDDFMKKEYRLKWIKFKEQKKWTYK